MDDHTLLIRLDEKIESIKNDIKSFRESFSTNYSDHENRIRDIEHQNNQVKGAITLLKILYGSMVGIAAILGSLIWLKK